ncbi:MAG: gamma-glutamyltransferase family protein, partial [Tetragenococcus halophilus]|nr:gamma-glutamyltransferase family protein [Tetragenococcus halophilus]MDN6725111.1 gamma-glutamyltransferase family protein [Tetragenococcus halophilus]
LNPQEAIDAPRWQWTSGKSVQLEPSFPFHIAEALKRRGHNIQLLNETIMIGRGQIILQQDDGVYVAATEGRTDGYIAVW